MVSVIVPAAGVGRRMGAGVNKVLLPLEGELVLLHTLKKFSAVKDVMELIVAVGEAELSAVRDLLEAENISKPWKVVSGGKERQDSVAKGLEAVSAAAKIILVHDAARPLVTVDSIEKVLQETKKYGAAVLAVPVKDTVKIVMEEGFVRDTPPREKLWAVQTPQGFRRDVIESAYVFAQQEHFVATDDAGLVERMGHPVKIVQGDYTNFKITTPEDMWLATEILKKRAVGKQQTTSQAKETLGAKPAHKHPPQEEGSPHVDLRFGMGYDVHRLVEGRRLILGGVEIPHKMGLLGHSDADVLLHAISDALLGAAALGDIGRHFPDTDPEYEGADSLKLLSHVTGLLKDKGYAVSNVDATVVAQKPKLAPYIETMRENIAQALDVALDRVNVKATTEEKLGFTGKEEGISAYAVASVTSVACLTASALPL